jgi:hypothetical protein
MDSPLTPEQQTLLIEDALQTFPIAPIPRDISAEVRSRIQLIPAPRPFHLTWNDIAFAILLALCIGAVWFGLFQLPPLVVAQIRKESILLYQYMLVNARWLIPVLSFSVAGLLFTLTIPYLRQELMKKSS